MFQKNFEKKFTLHIIFDDRKVIIIFIPADQSIEKI